MDAPKIWRAICGSPETPLRIGDTEIQCYVLEGGIRVLSGRGIQHALNMGNRHGTLLRLFNGKNPISSYVSNKIAIALNNPYNFIRPGRGGKTALGYDATLLVDLCEIVLQARSEGNLPSRWERISTQCEMLTRAFAKTGIIALIDEATGYQALREKDALNQFLSLYLTEERLKWAKRFPDVFYREIYRLNNWDWPPKETSKRPGIIGYYTNNIVYERLPEGVLEKLKELNPTDAKTRRRRYHHHRFFSEDIGQPDLQMHLVQIIAIMRASTNWRQFMSLIDRAFPKGPRQFDLPM